MSICTVLYRSRSVIINKWYNCLFMVSCLVNYVEVFTIYRVSNTHTHTCISLIITHAYTYNMKSKPI